MNPKRIHRSILRRLLSLRQSRHVSRVRLVARLHNAELLGGNSVRPVLLFIPDLHLLSHESDDCYRFSFLKLEPGRSVKRAVLLDQFCQAILDFRNTLADPRMLKIVQLGDLVDLWRENEIKGDTLNTMMSRILDDNPEARRRLVRKGAESLKPDVVQGNHDWRLSKSHELRRANPAHVYKVDGKKTILVTHGHFFDWIEDFSDELQEFFVETFGRSAKPRKHQLDRKKSHPKEDLIDEEETFWPDDNETTGPQGAAPRVLTREEESDHLPAEVNVWVTRGTFNLEKMIEGHRLLPRALTYAKRLRAGTKRYVNRLRLSGRLPHLQTIVIGHSHYARICIHYEWGTPAKHFVLVDCGAWIGYARFGNTLVPSCQIGVLCGGDMRIYQLDPHPRLFSGS